MCAGGLLGTPAVRWNAPGSSGRPALKCPSAMETYVIRTAIVGTTDAARYGRALPGACAEDTDLRKPGCPIVLELAASFRAWLGREHAEAAVQETDWR